jgi:hypothetical protein
MRAWPHDLIRVRIEGHDDHRQRQLGGEPGGAVDIALVTTVHAVEDADGHD